MEPTTANDHDWMPGIDPRAESVVVEDDGNGEVIEAVEAGEAIEVTDNNAPGGLLSQVIRNAPDKKLSNSAFNESDFRNDNVAVARVQLAIRDGWGITADDRVKVVQEMRQIITKETSKDENKVKAARIIQYGASINIQLEKLDQENIHHDERMALAIRLRKMQSTSQAAKNQFNDIKIQVNENGGNNGGNIGGNYGGGNSTSPPRLPTDEQRMRLSAIAERLRDNGVAVGVLNGFAHDDSGATESPSTTNNQSGETT